MMLLLNHITTLILKIFFKFCFLHASCNRFSTDMHFFAEFETHYTTFQGLKQPLKLGTHMYLFTLLSKYTDPKLAHQL